MRCLCLHGAATHVLQPFWLLEWTARECARTQRSTLVKCRSRGAGAERQTGATGLDPAASLCQMRARSHQQPPQSLCWLLYPLRCPQVTLHKHTYILGAEHARAFRHIHTHTHTHAVVVAIAASPYCGTFTTTRLSGGIITGCVCVGVSVCRTCRSSPKPNRPHVCAVCIL